MRVINLDAAEWKKPLDFYDALLLALKAPPWHGRGIDALIDSMVYGGINEIEPPYRIWIVGTSRLPADVREELDLAVDAINRFQGIEKEIEFQIDP
jgi:hypothetical protein